MRTPPVFPIGTILILLITSCASTARVDAQNHCIKQQGACSKRQCKLAGGTWLRAPMAKAEFCDVPTPDAYEDCMDSSECAVECITTDAGVARTGARGHCAASYTNPFGCSARIDNGIPGAMICVD